MRLFPSGRQSAVSSSRRITVVAAIACVTALAAAGCSPSAGSDENSAKTLTIWTYQTAEFAPYLADYEKTFKASHPDVTLEYLTVPFDQLTSKIVSAASTRTGPDLVVFDPATTASLVEAGALADISEKWDSFADKDEFPDFAHHQVDGKTYAVQSYVNTTALYYNADILKAAGITSPPKTFSDLQADLEKVVASGHKGIAQCGAPTSECETQAAAWILGSGGNYNDFTSPKVLDVFQAWYDLGQAGALGADSVAWGQGDAWAGFAKGDYAFAQNGNWKLSEAKDLTFDWGVVPLPGARVAPGGEGQAIGAFSDNQELAWEYLTSTWLTSEGQVKTFTQAGSIPIRLDAQADPAVAGNEYVGAWTTELEDTGTRSTFKNPSDYLKATVAVGEQWSALRQGRVKPEEAAQTLSDSLAGVFAE